MSDTKVLENEFYRTYSKVMLDVWQNDEDEAKLLADPTAFAAEKGLPVAPGSIVQLDRSQPEGLYTSGKISKDWNDTPGVHILHVPTAPMINFDELTDAELETVGAGFFFLLIIVVL